MYLYLLHWDSTPQTTMLYGSTLTHAPDGTVSFSNRRQTPGAVIHTWENLPVGALHKSHPTLPLLQRGHTYGYQLNAAVHPVGTTGANIQFLDAAGATVGEVLQPERKGEFTFPENAADYRIELLNMNNERLNFRSLYLAESPTLAKLMVTEATDLNLVHAHDGDQHSAAVDVVAMRRRAIAEPLWLSGQADQYFLRFTHAQLTDPEWLELYAEKLGKHLHKKFGRRQVDLTLRAETAEAEGAIEAIAKVLG